MHQNYGIIISLVLPFWSHHLTVATATEIVDATLVMAQQALHSCIHMTLHLAPEAQAFHCDMLLPLVMAVNYRII